MLVDTQLRAVALALAEGWEAEGFRALLEAYTSGGRTAELAAAVFAVGERLAPRHPDDPHLSALRRYEVLTDAAAFVALDDQLSAVWRDPRVEALALRALEEARFSTGPTAAQLYARLVNSLSGAGTPSVVARLTALFDRVRADPGHPLRRDGPELLRALARAATKIRPDPPPPLSADARQLLEGIVAGGAPPTSALASLRRGDALLEAVWAEPDSDGPRLVYADWLAEHGDPRGELIIMQCERARRGGVAPSEREAKLVAAHGHEWLGPLGPAIMPGLWSRRFERGFLAAAELIYFSGDLDPLAAVVDHPSWSTVVELSCGGGWLQRARAAPLLVGGATRSLKVVRSVGIDDLRALASADLSSVGWQHLGVVGRGREALLQGVTTLEGLPALETLELSWLSLDDLEVLFPSAVGRRLRRLTLDGPEPVAEWARAAWRWLRSGSLVELRHHADRHRLCFTRDPSGGLAVAAELGSVGQVDAWVTELSLLAPPALHVTRLSIPRPHRRRPSKVAQILEPLRATFGERLVIQDS